MSVSKQTTQTTQPKQPKQTTHPWIAFASQDLNTPFLPQSQIDDDLIGYCAKTGKPKWESDYA